MDAGLNATVTPVGCPDALSAITELNPPVTLLVMVDVPELPSATESDVGEADKANPGCTAAVTVRLTVVVRVTPPPVAVTVIGYVLAATVEDTVAVMVELPDPGAAMEAGLKPTVTPLGWPEALRATALLKPPETAVVTVELPELPSATEIAVGEAESENVGVALVTDTFTSSRYI
jgi:hypothetical protein